MLGEGKEQSFDFSTKKIVNLYVPVLFCLVPGTEPFTAPYPLPQALQCPAGCRLFTQFKSHTLPGPESLRCLSKVARPLNDTVTLKAETRLG